MPRLLWMTDVHWNFLPPGGARAFGEYLLKEQAFDGVVISGDIGEAHNFDNLLESFASAIAPRKCYFVLGNHDYYKGSFAEVREAAQELEQPNLIWLDNSEPILLDATTALVGHQGWFDGRSGNPEQSRVVMSDFEYISDLNEPYYNEQTFLYYGREDLLRKLRELGKQAAEEARPKLNLALSLRRDVVFVTHFPPFKGACWHEGSLSDSHWQPWFTCIAMGEMLAEAAHHHPDNRILVLCGHTHSPGEYHHLPNLCVLTGKAKYGAPDVCGVLELPLAETLGSLPSP